MIIWIPQYRRMIRMDFKEVDRGWKVVRAVSQADRKFDWGEEEIEEIFKGDVPIPDPYKQEWKTVTIHGYEGESGDP
ncbi:hypothetical protein [Paludifilum halophilum]|uniref:hypothetical protein n=1 Tax=Paludifilum halophilum TaxID=1642702 RepID=UPI00113FF23B|nr:hypothetical protein [Paludifilum halophilum]